MEGGMVQILVLIKLKEKQGKGRVEGKISFKLMLAEILKRNENISEENC